MDLARRRRNERVKVFIRRGAAETQRKSKKNGDVEVERGASSMWIRGRGEEQSILAADERR
jgi:hypothetical protein